jgi:glycerate-2-kinase
VPGEGSFAAGAKLLDVVRRLEPSDLLVVLLSGGGSATAEVAAEGLTPGDLRRTTELLLGSGAPIGEMNPIRRHLSKLKGGQLAAARGCRAYGTLAISDVVGDAPEDIASGPTVPDPSTFADAIAVLRRYGFADRLPRRVLDRLRDGAAGQHPETPKPGDRRLTGAPFVLGATNRIALVAAAAEARRRGYSTSVVPRPVTGETAAAAVRFARMLVAPRAMHRAGSFALLAGGETTVTLGPHPGRGGRNQEFAITAARPIAGRDALVLSAGSDGIDGPTDAAGGWVDGRSWAEATRRGVDLEKARSTHSAYAALDRLGTLLKTGATGTNVMDLHVGLGRAAPADRVRYEMAGREEVVRGPEHWEFPAPHGRFSASQLAWFERSGVGFRAFGPAPKHGRPYWDALVPFEADDPRSGPRPRAKRR